MKNMPRSTNISNQDNLETAHSSSSSDEPRICSLDRKFSSPYPNAAKAVSIASDDPDRIEDRYGPTAMQTSREQSAPLSSRAAAGSLKTDIEHQAPSSQADEDLTGICLCQPEPKIPRPRNAFILYRQHRQAQVAAQNPKLTNPEISKVIGECWRTESESVKEQWKAVADEEKLRHQQQYPEYRYQPRRPGRRDSSGKFDSPSPYISASGELCCKRCGGRNIATPNDIPHSTKLNPILPPLTPSTSLLQSRCLPMINNLNLKSPGLPSPHPTAHFRDNPKLVQVRARPGEEATGILSPDGKRRRLNYQYLPHTHRPGPDTPHPFSQHHFGREAMLHQRAIPQSSISASFMSPPPRPHATAQLRQTDQRGHLPAIRTEVDQSRSVEAMVMSIPLLSKLKVLSSIAPALRVPGPNSPTLAVRGALIAVEGDRVESAENCASRLETLLGIDGDFRLKTVRGPRAPEVDLNETCLKNYLDTISQWHKKSLEIKAYITSLPENEDIISGDGTNEAQLKRLKPVVIVSGYQLHASDEYASRIAITDAYAPTDHWQWMATLWRGIVGADLTVYVKDCSQEELSREKPVEIRDEAKCIIVRKSKDSKEVDESAFRRLSFEVGEWVRLLAVEKG